MSEPILCHECGHDIDIHGRHLGCERCACAETPSDIARALLTAEPTEAEKRARWDVESGHHFHGVDCLCGFTSPVSRQRTEHITGALMDALRAARGRTDIAAEGERLRRDYDESLARADQWLGLLHQARADAIRAEALKLRAEHPDHHQPTT